MALSLNDLKKRNSPSREPSGAARVEKVELRGRMLRPWEQAPSLPDNIEGAIAGGREAIPAPVILTAIQLDEELAHPSVSAVLESTAATPNIERHVPPIVAASSTENIQFRSVNIPSPPLEAHGFDLTAPTEINGLAKTSTAEALNSPPFTIDNKPETNRKQIGYTASNKLETNRQQTGNRNDSSVSKSQRSGNKSVTQPTTQPATNWKQTDNKPATEVPFSGLVGLQRQLVLFLYAECKLTFSRTTEQLTLEHIANEVKSAKGTVKTTLQRLEQKLCIKRIDYKIGRGGWSQFELPESMFRQLQTLETSNKLTTNRQQTSSKSVTQPATQPATATSCSSSISVSDKTTTTDQASSKFVATFQLPASLEGKVSRARLETLVSEGTLPREELERSLGAFAYDLEAGRVKSKTGNVFAVLFGALGKGGYVSEAYLNAQASELADLQAKLERSKSIQFEIEEAKLQLKFQDFLAVNPEQAEALKAECKFVSNFEPGTIGYRTWRSACLTWLETASTKDRQASGDELASTSKNAFTSDSLNAL